MPSTDEGLTVAGEWRTVWLLGRECFAASSQVSQSVPCLQQDMLPSPSDNTNHCNLLVSEGRAQSLAHSVAVDDYEATHHAALPVSTRSTRRSPRRRQ